MMINEMTALIKRPYGKTDPLAVKVRFAVASEEPIIPKRGVMKAATKALMSSLKAPPTTTATARSTTLPLRTKSLKPAM